MFRKITNKEIEYVYQMGYKEWAKGRTYEAYIKENQKEETHEVRYVFEDNHNHVVGSMIVVNFYIKHSNQTIPLYGLGSIVIDYKHRHNGYGKKMIQSCISYYEQQEKDCSFILYSDIPPFYYEQFQFRKLPKRQQRYAKSTCMVRCNENMCRFISTLQSYQIPSYF